jgi:hypothetical protein
MNNATAQPATPLSHSDISPASQGQLSHARSALQCGQVLVAPTQVGEMSAVRTKGLLAKVGASTDLYNTDYYAWTQKIKQMLESRAYEQLDVDNLIDEVNDMGINIKRGLRSHLSNLLLHLLKWEYQPVIQSGSWKKSIHYARQGVQDELEYSPSLKHQLEELFVKAYARARKDASQETGIRLATFPEQCPYSLEQALAEDWLPA